MRRVFLSLAMGVLLVCPGRGTPISYSDPTILPPAAHKIQIHDPALGRDVIEHGGRLIADYGGYQLYETAQLGTVLTNGSSELRDEYNLILLNAARLDTSKPEVQALRSLSGNFEGKRMHLVHFAGPIQPAWRTALRQTGAQVVGYVPHNAYLVYGDSNAIAQIQAMAAVSPQIQWEGAYLADYKTHPKALARGRDGRPRDIGTDRFAIQLIADDVANVATLKLVDELKLEPIQRQQAVLHYVDIVGRFAAADLNRIAARPDVVSIQPFFVPRKTCERQDQIVAGNLSGGVPSGPGYLAWLAAKGFTQAQFAASGFIVDVADSGIDDGTVSPRHFGLYVDGETNQGSRVEYARLAGTPNPGSTLKGCDGHGTINGHIVGGYDNFSGFPFEDASGYHYGLGVCPFVGLGSSVVFDPDNWTNPDYTALVSSAYHSGARISNNSWGGSDGMYDMVAQEYDALVRDAEPAGATYSAAGNQEIVAVFAAGNDGPDGETVNSPATAKNVIAVGAADSVQPFGGAADGSDYGEVTDDDSRNASEIPDFSSRGPCNDGRHKPDLMAPGTHVSGGVVQAANPGPDGTADSCFLAAAQSPGTFGVDGGPGTNGVLDPFFPDGQEFYTSSSGSSHATPCVSGGCALLRQFFVNKGLIPPSPAMTKAYLMNSARYLTGSGAGDTLWSDNQGMGELDLGMAFDGTPRILRDELAADLFTATGQVRTISGTIAATNKPFKVTVAWTDAPGSTTGAAYDNDLDLTVTAGGVTYKGNVFKGQWSASGGAADQMNNVESVFLPAGVSGSFEVAVTAANINSVGVPNADDALEQDFALVIYNASEMAIAAPVVLFPPAGFSTNNPSLIVTGSGIAGASVSIYDGTTPVGSGVVSAAGKFAIVVKLPVNGSHTLTATEVQGGVVSSPSAAVTISLTLIPEISVQPQTQAAFLQDSVKLFSGAMGALPFKYFWLRNGALISRANSTSLTLPAVTTNSVASYQFVASNAYGAATSSVAIVTLVPNPFSQLGGAYYGLFSEATERFQSSGLLTFNLTTLGKFSGSLLSAGARYAFTGQLSLSGNATVTIVRAAPQHALTVDLYLDLVNGTDQVTGTVSDGTWTAALEADLAIYSARQPCPQQGSYSLLLTNIEELGGPEGDSYGRVSVNADGLVTFSGVLSDNAVVAPAAVSVSKFGQCPLYIPLYGGFGSLSGWIIFTNGAALAGSVDWFKTRPSGNLYPSGFTNSLSLTGSKFASATTQTPVLPLTNYQITLSGANLPVAVSNNVRLQSSVRFVTNGSGISDLTLSVNPSTGVVTGSFLDAITKSIASIKGIVLEQQTNAAGFFLTPAGSGLFELKLR